jgi:hypothetical protein
MAKLVQSNSVKGPVFDPNRNVPYKWEPDDIFEITGQQFAAIYHALNSEVKNPGGAPMFLTYEAYQAVMSVFAIGVQQGVIREADHPKMEDPDGRVSALFNADNKSE